MGLRKKIKIIILSFFILYFSAFSFSQISGQGAIKISPVRIEENVEPGDVIENVMKITNISGVKTVLYPYILDFKAGGETGYPELLPKGSYINGLGSWIDISEEGIDFEVGEEKEISFSIRVPDDIGPGGYYGALTFGSLPPESRLRGGEEERGAVIAVGQQTGCLVLLKVLGEITEDAIIREFTTDKDFYNTPFQVNFLSRIENLGNVHIKPYGTIKIKNMLGKDSGAVIFNDTGSNVLPDSIRRFENLWEGELGFGRYTASLILNFGTSPSEGGQGMQTIYAETLFWIVPWRILIPLILALIFTASLFFLFLRIYRNKAIERAMMEAGVRRARYVKKYEGTSPALHFILILALILIVVLIILGLIFLLFFA